MQRALSLALAGLAAAGLAGCGSSHSTSAFEAVPTATPSGVHLAGTPACQRVELIIATDGAALSTAIGQTSDEDKTTSEITSYLTGLQNAAKGGSPALVAAIKEYSDAVTKILDRPGGQKVDVTGVTAASADLAKACVSGATATPVPTATGTPAATAMPTA